MPRRKKIRTQSTRTEGRPPSPPPTRAFQPDDIEAALRRQPAQECPSVRPAVNATEAVPEPRWTVAETPMPVHIDPLIDAMGQPAPRVKEAVQPQREETAGPPPLPSQIDFAIDILAAMPIWIVIFILVAAGLGIAGVVCWETVAFAFPGAEAVRHAVTQP
jgi:hypothetical protein